MKKDKDKSFDSFYEVLVKNPKVKSTTLYRLIFGDHNSQKFHVRITPLVYKPSLPLYAGDPPLPVSSIIYAFEIHRSVKLKDRSIPNRSSWLTIKRTGEWMLRDEQMANPERTDINQIGKMIRSWISDEEIWEAIYRDR